MMEALFFGSVGLVVFTCIGYPLSLLVLRPFLQRPVQKSNTEPEVSVVIAAHNEEAQLAAKLQNILSAEYPAAKREVIVVSDGSTDRTNEIAASFAPHVTLYVLDKQQGKEAALAWGVRQARSQIVIMTDVDTHLHERGIREIAANFHDPSVGCVTGEDRVLSRGGTSGERLYVDYGTWVRRLESSVNSVIGLSGSFCAARKSLCVGLTDHPIDCDFKIALNALRQGLRAVNDPAALGSYQSEKDCNDEFKRKLRTTMRGLTALVAHRELLNPVRYGMTSYQILCRKALPWCTPYLAMLAFVSSGLLAVEEEIWPVVWGLQVAFYVTGGLGYRYPALARSMVVVPLAAYVVLCQSALLIGWYRVLKGDQVWTWQPTNH